MHRDVCKLHKSGILQCTANGQQQAEKRIHLIMQKLLSMPCTFQPGLEKPRFLDKVFRF